jgi:hypothetical protein
MKNKIVFPVIVAAIAFAMVACSTRTQLYDKNGLSFSYPAGWSITADDFDGTQGYLSLEKSGATVTFGWLATTADINADMMLQSVFQDMQVTESFADFVPEETVDATYGTYPARAVTYTANIGGVPQSGAVWVFKAEGRVVNVAVREGTSKANVADFKTIKDSFTLK